MFAFWLWIHILSVIIAFGPTFAFPLIGMRAKKNPPNAAFAIDTILELTHKLTYPFAVVALVAGVALILTLHINLFATTWLLIALVLYLIALGYSVLVQSPTGHKLVEALRAMPPGPPPEGATGPPPEIAAMVKRQQMGGILLTLLFLTIFTLMIVGTNVWGIST